MILGLLSDAHGNREAFEQGVSFLRQEGADAVYFLGDAVGYLPGDGVLDAIQEANVTAIIGNHDAMLLTGEIDPQGEAIHRLAETMHALSAANRTYLETLPDRLEVQSPFGKLMLVHGSPDDPLRGYVYPDTDLASFAGMSEQAVFMGQTHRPFIRRSGETLFVNVGSCGLPRDCGHLGAACLFDDVSGVAQIIRFDITEATNAALRRCGPVAAEVRGVFARRSPGGCYGSVT